MSLILYLHGMHSSPNSLKATQAQQYFSERGYDFHCFQLHWHPLTAFLQVQQWRAKHTGAVALLGSSMGGFMATYFAAQWQAKAVVVNPAVRPTRLLRQLPSKQWHPYWQCHYQIDESFVNVLNSLTLDSVQHPKRIWLLQQSGDEVLHWCDAVQYYQDCKQTLEWGGDHSFLGFARFLPEIEQFFTEK